MSNVYSAKHSANMLYVRCSWSNSAVLTRQEQMKASVCYFYTLSFSGTTFQTRDFKSTELISNDMYLNQNLAPSIKGRVRWDGGISVQVSGLR